MQTLRRYRYVFTLLFILFVLFSLLLGGWIEGQFFQTPRSVKPPGSLTGGTSSQTPGKSGSVSNPTTYRPGGRLIIPGIGVNASIEPVGVLSDGNLAVPTQKPWDGVGWYQYGPYPGDQGSAVIDGHLDRPGGSPAVFWNLRNLHIGDMVMVVNPGEKSLHFRVINMKYYAPNNAPLQTIFENKMGIFLNLITCAGQWIPNQHQTTLRLVIYTVLA
ncbi:MAG TPA: class F sortase [Ktedonobacteraceae bacterium]|nr:class F sortase [Ktedonobacteraceae bacterium]